MMLPYDASIVAVPIPRNHREENRRIKAGELPQDGRGEKRAQKDVDGRWTRKRGNHSSGNKNHISIDAEHKIIRRFQTTPAHMRMKVSATNR